MVTTYPSLAPMGSAIPSGAAASVGFSAQAPAVQSAGIQPLQGEDKTSNPQTQPTAEQPVAIPPEIEEMNKMMRAAIPAAILAAAITLVGHGKLTHWMKNGQMLAFCQKMDQRFAPLNRFLTRRALPHTPLCDKLATRTSTQQVMKDAITTTVDSVLGWAKKSLPDEVYTQWSQQLGTAHTFEQLQNSINFLKKQTTDGPLKGDKKILAQLQGLEKRAEEGLRTRYFEPYKQTKDFIDKGKLGPVGQSVLHALQSARQMLGADFAFQAIGQKSNHFNVMLNGALTLGFPIGALFVAERNEKLKRFGEELWGNTLGNFMGWYWGTQWLNHGGWITKGLNAIKPGLATKPFLAGTVAGVLTEMAAIFGIGTLISKVGTGISHTLLGKPRKWIEPKMPADYKPLIKKTLMSEQPGLIEQGRITALSTQDLKALMSNPNAIEEQKTVDRLEPRLEKLTNL